MSKKRCSAEGCNIKLTFVNSHECKCGLKFCLKHRLPESHSCKFDFKTHDKIELINNTARLKL